MAHYSILEVLGQGTFGIVFKAKGQGVVAIKAVSNLFSSMRLAKAVIREISVLR